MERKKTHNTISHAKNGKRGHVPHEQVLMEQRRNGKERTGTGRTSIG
jgi:hypothetical protein